MERSDTRLRTPEDFWQFLRNAMNRTQRAPMLPEQERTCRNVFYSGMKASITFHQLAQALATQEHPGDPKAMQDKFDDLLNDFETAINNHALETVKPAGRS